MKYDAIVIGAGPNGLVAASVLAKGAKRVLVLDSAGEIGGQTRTIEFAPGFRAPLNEDCGWIPPQVEKLLGLNSVERVARGRCMSVAPADGEMLTLRTSVEAATTTISRYSEKDAQRWPAFVERLHKFSGILGALYQLAPPDIDTTSVREVMPLIRVARQLRGLGRDDMTEFLRIMPMSIQDLVDDTFETEIVKAALAAAAIRDIQQGPRSGGTTFNLLHYMVGAERGSFRARPRWKAGPDGFVRAATEANRTLGVTFRMGTDVESVVVKDDTVVGVCLASGEEIAAPIVISTADPRKTLFGMVDPILLDPEFLLAVKNIKMRGCTAYVLYGSDVELSDPSTPFSSPVSLTSTTAALERASDAAKYGEISAEPHVEVFVPTLRWPQLAPAKHHVVVARVQYAPYHLKASWDTDRACGLQEAVTALIGRAIPRFAESVRHSAVLTPRDLEQKFGVTEGAMTHGELMLDQILFMRPVPGWGHHAMPIPGLFLGGAGAHPGPGILGGAGFLAAQQALSGKHS